MNRARYSFKRADGISAFGGGKTVSTDALKALGEWHLGKDRSYEIHSDTNDELVADLCFGEGDDAAGPGLDDVCEKFGVHRPFVDNLS